MSTSHIPDYGTIITINKQDTNQNNNNYDTNPITPKNTHKSSKTSNKTCQSIGLISVFIILAIFALYHFGFVSLGTNNNLISLFQTNNKQLNTNNNNSKNSLKSDTWIPTPTIPDIGKRPTGECEVQCNHLCNGDIPCEDLCNVFPQFCYNDDGSHECQFISYCTDYNTYSTSPPQ